MSADLKQQFIAKVTEASAVLREPETGRPVLRKTQPKVNPPKAQNKTPVKQPPPILKKVSSFDRPERQNDSIYSVSGLHFDDGMLSYTYNPAQDEIVKEDSVPSSPHLFSFFDRVHGRNGWFPGISSPEDESSSSCSSSLEAASPPPRIANAAAPQKKRVTFAVPEVMPEPVRKATPYPPRKIKLPVCSRKQAPKPGRVAPEGIEQASPDSVRKRCGWITAQSDPTYVAYHDEEWGVPVHEDKLLFELLTLAGAQAELSWSALLNKRTHYREAFAGFDPAKVAKFDEEKIHLLANDAEILQHDGKIRGIVENAKCILDITQEFGSFDKFIWQFVNHKPICNKYRTSLQVPVKTPKSEYMSKDLIRRGFRSVGPTIMYSFMQAAGMTNDHIIQCFRYHQVQNSNIEQRDSSDHLQNHKEETDEMCNL